MPRGKGRGGRGGRKRGSKGGWGGNRELEYADEGEEYAQIKKILGNMRVLVHCFASNKERVAKIRGKLKKVRIFLEDIVLVSLREDEDDKCDLVYVYRSEEAKTLRAANEIPDNINILENVNRDVVILFENEEDDTKTKVKEDKKKTNIEDLMPSSSSGSDDEDADKPVVFPGKKTEQKAPEKPHKAEPVPQGKGQPGKKKPGKGSDDDHDDLADI